MTGITRWMDIGLDECASVREMTQASISLDTRAPRPATYLRFRRGMLGQPQPVGGAVGLIELQGDLDPILPILAAAETCHVGSFCTLGLGAFEVLAGAARPSPMEPLFLRSNGTLV